MFHTGTQPTFIDKEQTAHANQWQNIINYTICQKGAKYVGLVHGIGQGDQEYGFKYADAAGNLAEIHWFAEDTVPLNDETERIFSSYITLSKSFPICEPHLR